MATEARQVTFAGMLNIATILVAMGAAAVLARQSWVRQRLTAEPSRPPAVSVPSAPLNIKDSPELGDMHSPVVAVEFADFQCPYCRQFALEILPSLRNKYFATGLVSLAYENFPLDSIHPNAKAAALVSKCAAKAGEFWAVHDRLFSHQDDLSSGGIEAALRGSPLATEALTDCVKSQSPSALDRERTMASSLGVTGTPTFFVGRRTQADAVEVVSVLVGAVSSSEFAAAFQRALNSR